MKTKFFLIIALVLITAIFSSVIFVHAQTSSGNITSIWFCTSSFDLRPDGQEEILVLDQNSQVIPSNQVFFQSCNPDCITVSSTGMATAAPGAQIGCKADITVSAAGSASVHNVLTGEVRDSFPIHGEGVVYSCGHWANNDTVAVGDIYQVRASNALVNNASIFADEDIAGWTDWISSNTSVATVDSNGVIRGVSPGTANICGSYQGSAQQCISLNVTKASGSSGSSGSSSSSSQNNCATSSGGMSTTPDAIPGLLITRVAHNVSQDGTITATINIKNTTSSELLITYRNYMSRCNKHTGFPYIGDPTYQGHLECEQDTKTASSTIDLAPGAPQNITDTVHQYGYCGATQLDIYLNRVTNKVTGASIWAPADGTDGRMIYGEADGMCNDCSVSCPVNTGPTTKVETGIGAVTGTTATNVSGSTVTLRTNPIELPAQPPKAPIMGGITTPCRLTSAGCIPNRPVAPTGGGSNIPSGTIGVGAAGTQIPCTFFRNVCVPNIQQ